MNMAQRWASVLLALAVLSGGHPRLGAGRVQGGGHSGDRHPDRTCRAGGEPDVLGRGRDLGRWRHRN